MQLGTITAKVLSPFVWLVRAVTFGRIDLGRCAGCKAREAYLNKLFGEN